MELRRKETSLSDKIVKLTDELKLTQSQGSRDSKKCLLRKLFDVKIRINNLVRGGSIISWTNTLKRDAGNTILNT